MYRFWTHHQPKKNKRPSTRSHITSYHHQRLPTELEVVNEFTYLGSTISNNLSLDKEIDRQIGKAASTLARLRTRVWKNPRLTIKTKVAVYNACVLSTLLYGSESWTTYAAQERRLNTFQTRSLRKLLGITWMSRTPNTVVLARCGLPTVFTMLRQRRLR